MNDKAVLDQIKRKGLEMIKNGKIKSMEEIHDHVCSNYDSPTDLIIM